MVRLVASFASGVPWELYTYIQTTYQTAVTTLSALDYAASKGELNLVQVCHARRSSQVVTCAGMDAAASNGHLDMVEWLHRHTRTPLQFLHEHRDEGCTVFAMHNAVVQKHMAIVGYLQSNRSEGCTSYTLVRAAQLGYTQCTLTYFTPVNMGRFLDVVEFLFANERQGTSGRQAFDLAATNGHFEVVRFLHAHSTQGCTTQAMDGAAQNGHFNIVKFLHMHRTEGGTAMGRARAEANGHAEIAAYLKQHLPPA
ncbi:hypothetical protein DYB30_005079 [Aphanomyces astaci]|uniref:Uncharacterized protein n=1 Tax=Aphanomyces astaci TaxID=112090 RepID=A0A397DC89_APHAT|nr:hypothetical protein DYB30_005079 [Aphanomyces astaci]RHY60828.1 hypothetical protein DYB38_006516 [Aphanomyces astaci]RHZ26676.1 hypothetical protein DYB26_011028 [Aphanomyces astaci]